MCRTLAISLSAILFLARFTAAASPARKAGPEKFMASAYSIEGKAASGSKSCRGTGERRSERSATRLENPSQRCRDLLRRIHVVDTGRKVRGHMIDIYVSSVREARQFGKKQVAVEILVSPAHR
jgi:hypothetical protein